ncbi:MAG TPA: outer membrane beta-barrel protein [Parafilimonas sp.]|nr:outer membrane beta-barrel protein [Parafilimonas sp.]
MKKIFLLFLLIASAFIAKSQTIDTTQQIISTPSPKRDWSKLDLSTRANDHFMVQYGVDGWPSLPDSINTSGFSRHFNAYLMIDKPFRTSPKFSIAFGVGIGSSNIFFSNTYINLKSNTPTLPFTNVSEDNHFNKFKLSTAYLEVPLELRFVTNPAQPDKGFKVALGIKGGLLLSAHTKGKDFIDSSGRSVYDPKYISKEYEKKFINNTRFALTGRIGFGHISLDGSYQVSSFLKAGTGPTINPYSVGITLSGL